MKDQTNVKRRAYDILNVLVSSGQLEKVGKRIGPSQKMSSNTQLNSITQLKKQIDQKKKTIERK